VSSVEEVPRPKEEVVESDSTRLHNEEFQFAFTLHRVLYYNDQLKEWMGGAISTYVPDESFIHSCCEETWNKQPIWKTQE